MDSQKPTRNIRVSAVAFIIAVGAMIRAISHDNVRAVTILSIFVAGFTAGMLLLNVIIHKNKD